MLAPSLTAMQPLATSALASGPSSSFCVAHGSATSHGTFHGVASAWKVAPVKWSAYSLIRPRRWVLWSLTHCTFSSVSPSGSWMKPPESDSVIGVAPSWISFSAACVATLPEPETTARSPARSRPLCLSMLSRK